MPMYDEAKNNLTFTNEESEASYCPNCGAEVDTQDAPEIKDGEVVRAWSCPACGLKGARHSRIEFDRHVVDTNSIDRTVLLSNTTHCLNGVLRAGDLVLYAPDGPFPCLPGQVTGIELPVGEPEQYGANIKVHINFHYFADLFSDARRKALVARKDEWWYQKLMPLTYRDDVEFSMTPGDLIKITDVPSECMDTFMDSEEKAISHTICVMRGMIPWPWWTTFSG